MQNHLPKEKLFTIAEVAAILGVSMSTLRRWELEKKILPVHTIGGHRRYTQHQVDILKYRKLKKIAIPERKPIKVIGNPVIKSSAPGLISRLICFTIVSYSLIFIARNPVVLASAIKDEFRPMGQVLGVSSTGGSNVTFGSTLDSNFNLSIKGVLNAGGISGVNYNAFAISGQTPKSSVISTNNDLFVGGDLEVAGTTNLTGTISPTGFTQGSIVFINSLGALAQDNSNLFYNSTSKSVGIGTSSPQGSLYIYGTDPSSSGKAILTVEGTERANIVLKPASNFSQVYALGGTPNLPFYISNSSGPLAFRADSATEIMRLTGGKVGIGTATPSQALHVNGGTDGTIEVDGAPGTIGASFKAYNTASGKMMSVDASGGLGRLRTDNTLMSFITSSGEVARFNGANFGIGTTAAAQKLQVSGGNIALETTTTSSSWDRWIGVNANNSMAIDPNLGTEIASSVDMQFFLDADANQTGRSFRWKTDGNTSGGGTELMRLQDTGELGIGTTTPGAKLEVSTATSLNGASSAFNITGTGTGAQTWQFIPTTSQTLMLFRSGLRLAVIANDASFSVGGVASDTGAGATLTVQGVSGGNVGIGNTSPVGKLDVSGAVVGKALAIFNETGNQALFTASASGVAKFTIQHSGLVDATADGLATKVVAGAVSDGSFSGTVVDGLHAVDSADGRFYFRYGGAWHYVAQTAGFQIPNYETFAYNFDAKSFDTNTPLKDGDFLIPFAEKHMDDGAVHGLYARIKDVADRIFKEVELVVKSLRTGKITITDDTVGNSSITAGTSEIEIQNGNVDENSFIYITATTPTDKVLYVKSKKAGAFTVGFASPATTDVSFNWWIVEKGK